MNWRFGFNNIGRNFEDSALQVIGIGLALTCILSLILLKNHLISDWQHKLPAQSVNYFIFNLEPDQTPALSTMLENNGVKIQRFYPLLRGRLTAINGESVIKLFGEEKGYELINFTKIDIKKSLSNAAHILVSTPPSNDFGDPVLAHFVDLIKNYAGQSH